LNHESRIPFSLHQTQIYAVGDNPLSDIKGANAAKWKSILVRTGVWQQPNMSNDTDNPATYVCNNVLEAASIIIKNSSNNNNNNTI